MRRDKKGLTDDRQQCVETCPPPDIHSTGDIIYVCDEMV